MDDNAGNCLFFEMAGRKSGEVLTRGTLVFITSAHYSVLLIGKQVSKRSVTTRFSAEQGHQQGRCCLWSCRSVCRFQCFSAAQGPRLGGLAQVSAETQVGIAGAGVGGQVGGGGVEEVLVVVVVVVVVRSRYH